MNLNPLKWSGWLLLLLFALAPASYSGLRNKSDDSDEPHAKKMEPASTPTDDSSAASGADTDTSQANPKDDTATTTDNTAPAKSSKPSTKPRTDRADAFVAGPDWEFDGFVAGGQDSSVRSMFYLNDLVYLNIGSQQGVNVGDKIGIYKRGEKVRDPQTGKFIGYEVRRAAYAKATDRVDEETCAVRILTTFEPVEIGDLARREQ